MLVKASTRHHAQQRQFQDSQSSQADIKLLVFFVDCCWSVLSLDSEHRPRISFGSQAYERRITIDSANGAPPLIACRMFKTKRRLCINLRINMIVQASQTQHLPACFQPMLQLAASSRQAGCRTPASERCPHPSKHKPVLQIRMPEVSLLSPVPQPPHAVSSSCNLRTNQTTTCIRAEAAASC